MIDTIRKQIQERLDQLLSEAEKLRGALAALDPRADLRRLRAPRLHGLSQLLLASARRGGPSRGAAPHPALRRRACSERYPTARR